MPKVVFESINEKPLGNKTYLMKEEKLIRGIGRWDLTAVVINCIIGAGIFGLPSKVYALLGSYSIVACVACAIIVAVIVLCYAEVASRFDATGGPYLYAREAYGSAVGFEVGWLYWLARVTTGAANGNLLIDYLGVFWPSITSGSSRILLIVALTLVLTLVNLIGIKQSTVFTNIFTVGKLVPMVLFAVVGLWFIAPANFNFEIVPSYGAASVGMVSLLYAFVGFEVAVIPGGEVKDPQRNFPFALLVGLAIVALLYITIQIVSIGTLPGLATSKTPLADAAANFMGPIGGLVIVAGASMSILGNLNVGLIGASRLLYAMGDRRDLPPLIAATHSTMKTPYVSLFITATVILILTVQLSFVSALAMATITRLVVYASTCIALPIFRKKHETDKAAFKVPLGTTIPIIALLLIVWLLVSWASTSAVTEGLPLVVAAAIGLVLYFLSKPFSNRRES